jgi:hypothetical protein
MNRSEEFIFFSFPKDSWCLIYHGEAGGRRTYGLPGMKNSIPMRKFVGRAYTQSSPYKHSGKRKNYFPNITPSILVPLLDPDRCIVTNVLK